MAKRGRPRLVDDAMREVVLSGFRWLTHSKPQHGAEPLTARAAIAEIAERLRLAKGTVRDIVYPPKPKRSGK